MQARLFSPMARLLLCRPEFSVQQQEGSFYVGQNFPSNSKTPSMQARIFCPIARPDFSNKQQSSFKKENDFLSNSKTPLTHDSLEMDMTFCPIARLLLCKPDFSVQQQGSFYVGQTFLSNSKAPSNQRRLFCPIARLILIRSDSSVQQ